VLVFWKLRVAGAHSPGDAVYVKFACWPLTRILYSSPVNNSANGSTAVKNVGVGLFIGIVIAVKLTTN
jgi:hypothetical protein